MFASYSRAWALPWTASYEEERIASANLDKAEFITEAMELTVLYYKGRPIDVQVRLRVSPSP